MRVYQVKGQEVVGVKAASQSGWRSDQKVISTQVTMVRGQIQVMGVERPRERTNVLEELSV